MKATLNGKRYDTDKYEVIAEKEVYTSSNNYAGSNKLLRASNGTLLIHESSNGQDLYRRNRVMLYSDTDYTIDDFNLDDAQEARCAELGLIDIID